MEKDLKKNICVCVCVCVCVCLVSQLCTTLWDPMDCSPPGSSIHGFSQPRILEWVAVSFSRESSQLKDWTSVSYIASQCFTIEPPGKPLLAGFTLLYQNVWLKGEKHSQPLWALLSPRSNTRLCLWTRTGWAVLLAHFQLCWVFLVNTSASAQWRGQRK